MWLIQISHWSGPRLRSQQVLLETCRHAVLAAVREFILGVVDIRGRAGLEATNI